MKTHIPIANIYYLLCYAWDRYHEGQTVSVSDEDFLDIANLLAKVLIKAVNRIKRRGVDRGYISQNEDTPCLRGKINFGETIKRNLTLLAKANCEFDELSFDVLHNQILKSTILKLTSLDQINKKTRIELRSLVAIFSDVSSLEIRNKHFRQLQFHRNNSYYDFLMKLCELFHRSILPTEKEGKYKFSDFFENGNRMEKIFEDFVRNFYRLEQDNFSVKVDCIKWVGTSETYEAKSALPVMYTDISLHSKKRTIVIDTKYHKDTLTSYLGRKKVKSENLYQIFSYLKNIECETKLPEGILLYPTVSEKIDYNYNIQGHPLRVYTLDLNQPWKNIHSELLNLIN